MIINRICLLLILLGVQAFALADGMLMLHNPAVQTGSDRQAHLLVGAYAANDMVPLDKLASEEWPADYRTRPGANLGVGALRAEVGGGRGNWRVGYFYRQDWLLKGNRDTVDAAYLNQIDALTNQTRTYDFDYSLRGFSADGLRLGYSKDVSLASGQRLVWGLSASLLHGRGVRKDETHGQLLSLAGSGTLNGNRRYFDSNLKALATGGGFNDFIPPEPLDTSSGWGYGFDFGVSWLGGEGASLTLVVNDLGGRVRWDRVPLIEQHINDLHDPFELGNAGAAVNGRNVYASLDFKLKPKVLLRGEYPVGRTILAVQLEGMDGHWFPRVGVSHPVSSALRVGIDYETRFGGIALSLRGLTYYLSLTTQKLDLAQSRALGVEGGLALAF